MYRFTIPIVVLGLFAICLLPARPALTDQQGEEKADKQSKLAQLEQERIETYEKIVPMVYKQYRSGLASFTDYAKAQEDYLKAKLEATDNQSDRIALLEQQLKVARSDADLIDQVHRAGGPITDIDVLRAKAHCLNIEIRLVKERNSEKPAH